MSDPRLFRNHAVARVRKRYDIRLTEIDREAITAMIHRNRYVWLSTDGRVNIVAAWYAGKWMPLVVRNGNIVTVLPKEELDRNKGKLLASNLYREIENLPPKEKDPYWREFKLSPVVAAKMARYFKTRLDQLNLTVENNWLKGFLPDFYTFANRVSVLAKDNADLEEVNWELREFQKEML